MIAWNKLIWHEHAGAEEWLGCLLRMATDRFEMGFLFQPWHMQHVGALAIKNQPTSEYAKCRRIVQYLNGAYISCAGVGQPATSWPVSFSWELSQFGMWDAFYDTDISTCRWYMRRISQLHKFASFLCWWNKMPVLDHICPVQLEFQPSIRPPYTAHE